MEAGAENILTRRFETSSGRALSLLRGHTARAIIGEKMS